MRSLIELYHDKKVLMESRKALEDSEDLLSDILNLNPELYQYLSPRLDVLKKDQAVLESEIYLEGNQINISGNKNLGLFPAIPVAAWWAIGIGATLLTTYGTSKIVQHVSDANKEKERLECVNALINSGMTSDEALGICGKPETSTGLLDTIQSYAKVFMGISLSVIVIYLISKWKKL